MPMQVISACFFGVAGILFSLLILTAVFSEKGEDKWREAMMNLVILQIIATCLIGGVVSMQRS